MITADRFILSAQFVHKAPLQTMQRGNFSLKSCENSFEHWEMDINGINERQTAILP